MYYAQECARDCGTASLGDRLYRFETKHARDAWVARDKTPCDYDASRTPVSRAEARRWYPEAFYEGVTWPQINMQGNYWDTIDDEDGAAWSGTPTGGVYADARC